MTAADGTSWVVDLAQPFEPGSRAPKDAKEAGLTSQDRHTPRWAASEQQSRQASCVGSSAAVAVVWAQDRLCLARASCLTLVTPSSPEGGTNVKHLQLHFETLAFAGRIFKLKDLLTSVSSLCKHSTMMSNVNVTP